MFFPTAKFKMKNKEVVENHRIINPNNKNSNLGFTLVELIVTLVIVGILATAALTQFIDLSHSAHAAACITNQLSLETAQTMYYTTNYLAGDAHYAESIDDLVPFLREEQIPQCPSGGTYKLLSDGKVTCTIPDHKR